MFRSKKKEKKDLDFEMTLTGVTNYGSERGIIVQSTHNGDIEFDPGSSWMHLIVKRSDMEDFIYYMARNLDILQ